MPLLRSAPIVLAPVAFAVVALSACGDSPQGARVDARPPAKSAAAATTGLPQFRPGLWEITDNGEGEMQTRQECRSEGDAELGLEAFENLPQGCTLDRQPRGGGLRLTATCDEDDTRIVQTVDLSGSDTEVSLHVTMTMQDKGQAPVDMGGIEGKARWLGPCPAAR